MKSIRWKFVLNSGSVERCIEQREGEAMYLSAKKVIDLTGQRKREAMYLDDAV